ncbi:hypothetical protein FVE85_5286 [Porphyridium purpureum]|uniref:SGNH hydrolase-type esterase domain-containing protein n=1 Tax=Porphyridium purpureum TaxID=35688 RepID=A0A5J4Z1I7_PORPP|nr:hypothetical protein FVE85_5286 [Porphyridium purpureum]|eukprot:POR7795..scf295_1
MPALLLEGVPEGSTKQSIAPSKWCTRHARTQAIPLFVPGVAELSLRGTCPRPKDLVCPRRTVVAAATEKMGEESKVPPGDFYGEYHGHTVRHLDAIYRAVGGERRPTIWLAGDSSLDNKYWLNSRDRVPACNGYEQVLEYQMPDVCYYLNKALADEFVCVNTAVEESRLVERRGSTMWEQDDFIRDHIKRDDVLVVSVGGNDVALKPSISTAWNMFKLVFFNSEERLLKDPARAWGMRHFVRMFKDDTANYIAKLIAKTKPRLVVACMIYFPDENRVQSWANAALKVLRYDSKPELLQAGIRAIWDQATTQIGSVDSVPVVGCALFESLDGKWTQDYVARVEPSKEGGAKMAEGIAARIRSNRVSKPSPSS